MAKTLRSRDWILATGVALVAVAVGLYLWIAHHGGEASYYTTTVSRGEIVQSVTATGIIQPVEDILVSSQISGYINSWTADFNTKVKKGDILCNLLPKNYEAAVKSAEGDLANAKANYDLQKITVDRDKQLLAKSLISQSDYDQAAAQLEEAEAQVQIKTAALDTARTNLSYCEIRSPIDGIVIKRAVEIGNSVAATLNSPTLYEIANDLTKMQIDTAVAEADIGNVEIGQEVNFSVDAYPDRQFHGKVFQIRNAPQTQQNVVIYDVMISVNNSDLKLKPGMTANVSIVVARRADALRLANTALRVRLPENLQPSSPETKPAAGEAAAQPKPMSDEERRQAIREIMQAAGYTRGSGPPSPEVLQRIQALAKERGVELPERLFGGNHAERPGAAVTRTIYVLPGGNPKAKPEAVQAKLGITDGANTEVIEGLKEGDVVITGVNLPANAPARQTNPFGPRRF